MPSGYVHCVVTSPPYWGQRDYALEDAGIGQESTLTEHIDNLVGVMREVRRVLRDDGTVWLELRRRLRRGRGAHSLEATATLTPRRVCPVGRFTPRRRALTPAASRKHAGYKAKDLMGLPWRVAFALQDDGWWLRSAIVWHKPSPMPESVRDRPTSAYEMIFLLAKRPRYFYDAEAIREPYAAASLTDKRDNADGHRRPRDYVGARDNGGTNLGGNQHGGANARNVWTFPSKGLAEPHYAAFPPELPRRCILAGTSEHGVCAECGARRIPWERVVDRSKDDSSREPRWQGGHIPSE